ncbi:hypothetical protein [Janthinobacterium lividum]|jgi:hypothetical protein|uniref:hypothetical protein n=1 Tax=Janthinobacterium lividum TaxID=29581 RepID=UPI0008FCC662|nr:hypothetical protein [Janthinobacterium lividum]MCC7716703.1 hypothetical protein [Janthinobacterium lividum]WQE31772.1 hypothetical protein U0004_29595 [Janthinobacterium lividum]
MNTEIANDIWCIQTLRLVQALLGAISSNFRTVGLSHDGSSWLLIFVLAEDNAIDREEIEDIACEFEALQEASITYVIDVVVTKAPIDWPSESVRVVYRRRED